MNNILSGEQCEQNSEKECLDITCARDIECVLVS